MSWQNTSEKMLPLLKGVTLCGLNTPQSWGKETSLKAPIKLHYLFGWPELDHHSSPRSNSILFIVPQACRQVFILRILLEDLSKLFSMRQTGTELRFATFTTPFAGAAPVIY